MRATDLFNNYREKINPPYSKKDTPIIAGTLFILVAIPLTVFLAGQASGLLTRAVGPSDIEAEATSLVGSVTVGDDTSASGGQYIEFGSSGISGTTYYLDCNAGNDGNNGTSESVAWKSLTKASNATLQAGDGLLLKRGCSWNGTLTIAESGTSANNIIVGAYGSGNLPIIQSNVDDSVEVNLTGSYIIVENIYAKGIAPSTESGCSNNPKGHVVGFQFGSSSHHNTIQNVEASGNYAGAYIRLGSNNNKILNSNFHDNIMMSPLDSGGSGDAGAFGVLLHGADNEVAFNTFSGQDACSYDYTRDGADVEIYRGKRNNVHHNVGSNSDAFAELGGDSTKAEDNTLAYNKFTSTLSQSIFLVLRGSGDGFGPTPGTKVYNNTVYLTGGSSQGVVCYAGCSSSILIMKNNILWAHSKAIYADASFGESNNIYWKTGGSPTVQGFTIDSSSKKADPQFVNTGTDFHLKSTSPAKDAGSSESVTAGYTSDLDNVTVPTGSAPDIGAYEYSSTSASAGQVAAAISSITIAAVGDMNPTSNTSSSSKSAKNGAAISAGLSDGSLAAFLGLGDFQYSTAYCYDYVNYWSQLWSGTKSKLYWVSAPNHDWEPGRNEDLDDFMNGQCAGDTTKSAINEQRGFIANGDPYSFDLGNWHFAMLSTALWRYDTTAANQATTWLDNDLGVAKAAGKHLAVAYHDPYFTSKTSSHDRKYDVKPWIDIMDKHDVRLTLSGSQHNYERSCPVTKDDVCVADSDPNGMTAFQVSTGGIGLRSFADSPSFIAHRFTNTWGWLKLTLNSDGSFSWQFNAVEGSGSDSGTRVAPGGGGPPDTEKPSKPTNLQANAISGTQVDLSWTASTDNVDVTGYKIFREGSQIDTSNTNSYSDKTVSPSTSYSYHVVASDAIGNISDPSEPVNVTTPCGSLPSDKGVATTSIDVDSSGTYRIWSRVMAPDTAKNSYYLQVDSDCGTIVGDSSIPTDTWTWVDYKGGNNATKIDMDLSSGSHDIKLVGRESSVKLDRVILTDDPTCVPTGTGDNCVGGGGEEDTESPSVTITNPAEGLTVTGTVDITATATDNVGVTKVEFYVDGSLKSTDTTSPYAYSWDTTTESEDGHALQARAFDAANNVNTYGVTVNVDNVDNEKPTTPTNLTASAPSYSKVDLSWTASTDNVGVTGYWIVRDGVTITSVTGTSYSDITVSAKTNYCYQVIAYDAANNLSSPSNQACVNTPDVPDTQAPTVPTGVSATAVSGSQINLSWTASTDNVGVTGYEVYRDNNLVNTVTTTSYGDGSLSAATTYEYFIKARDAAGNISGASNTASATTQAPPSVGTLVGQVTNSANTDPVVGAIVSVKTAGSKGKKGLVTTSTTNSSGVYAVTLDPGSYDVEVKVSGYRTQKKTTTITSNTTTTLNFSMIVKGKGGRNR